MSINQLNKLIADRIGLPQEGGVEEKKVIDKQIQAIASRLMKDPLIVDECRQESLSHLRSAIKNTYQSSGRLYFNLASITSNPSARNEVYNGGFCDPIVCNYQSGMDTPAVFSRISYSTAASVIPQRLLTELGGGLDPDNIDVYCKIQKIFPGHLEDVSGHKETLVRFHRWLFQSLPSDKVMHEYENKQFPRIGVFPSFGVTPGHAAPAPFNRMAETEVYAHPDNGMMLLSPDNAHIGLDLAAPFYSMWIAARQGDRACISKVIMIPNFYPPVEAIRFPELNEFVASIHLECNTVEKFTKNLEKFRPHVAEFCAKTFNPIIEAARLGKSDEILLLLGRLPPTFQGAIYERLWVIKGSPMGVHHDFGGASFKHDLSLAPKFHASNEEKIQAIEQASSLVIKELIDDTLFLHLHTKPLLPSEQVQRLRIETIDNLFNHLKKATSLAEKKAALCELDTFCESFLGGAKASHELFGRIYHLHINLKDCIDDYKEPNHPRFGEAAFFQIDGVTTRDDVLVIAMSDLKELILSKM